MGEMNHDTNTDVLFYTNSCYGVGHYQRTASLIKAIHVQRPDIRLTVVYGGVPWDPFAEFHFCRRIPLSKLTSWSWSSPSCEGIDPLPNTVEMQHVLRERSQTLRDSLGNTRISTLVIEYVPFSRHFLHDEAQLLIQIARATNPNLSVVCSVRDIVRELDHRKRALTEMFISQHINTILIHSDPTVVTFDKSYGDISGFKNKIIYTGVVVPPHGQQPEARPPMAAGSVCCAVGGGYDGYECALEFLKAWRRLNERGLIPGFTCARVFPGVFMPQRDLSSLRATMRLLMELDSVPVALTKWEDYPLCARDATVVVSMCGYNTCYELLSRNKRAIFWPRRGGEQELRARAIAARGWATYVNTQEALESGLVACMKETSSPMCGPQLDFGGADKTATILCGMCERFQCPGVTSHIVSDSRRYEQHSCLPPEGRGPRKAMIEIMRACNLRCPTCPVGSGLARTIPPMEWKLFRHIIDSVRTTVRKLSLFNYGETLLHPFVAEFVAYAKHAGIDTVTIHSNGQRLSPDLARALVKASLDELVVSVDGVDQKSYAVYRVGGDFSTLVRNLVLFLAIRKSLGSHKPLLYAQYVVMAHNEKHIPEFLGLCSQLGVDGVKFKTYNARMALQSELRADGFVPMNPFASRYVCSDSHPFSHDRTRCIWPTDVVTVNSDGTIVPCCYDHSNLHPLGRFEADVCDEWWATEARREFLHQLRKCPNGIELCSRCPKGKTNIPTEQLLPECERERGQA